MTDRITYDPAVMFGKPVIAGTRITVEHILRELSYGYRPQDVVANHPPLKPAGICAALDYAADFMALAHMADSLAREASKPKYQPPNGGGAMTDRITREIFVFGSNRAGRHGKGAALYAAQHYGAERGVGEGLTGNAYAVPTKGAQLERLAFSEIDASLCRFLAFARAMPEARFLLTPVGTGLAGHSKNDVWSVLEREGVSLNVVLTSTWIAVDQTEEAP